MAIKFRDEPQKVSSREEQLRAGNKALSAIVAGLADGTLRAQKHRGGRKPDPNSKKLLTLRLDPQVIEHFKATGEGWQTRMNDALRKAASL